MLSTDNSTSSLIRKAAPAFAILLMLLSSVAHAQSTLSQNQDGFNGETMDGFMNMDPDKDSTVVERTVSTEYSQWIIDTDKGLPYQIEPDTLHHSFHNVHLTEGMFGTYSHLGNMGSPRLSRLYFEREQPEDFVFDAPYDFWIKNPDQFRFTDAKTPHVSIDYYKGGNRRTGEEHLKGYFAANFNKRVGIGFDLDYQLGRGNYANQATSMFDARVYTYYRGDLYNIYVTANKDEIKVAENGGIQDRRYITNPEAMAEGRKQYSPEDIPFRLYQNWNNLKRSQAMLNQSLNIKTVFQQTDSIGDTILTYSREVELGNIAHTLEIGKLQRRYLFYQLSPGFYKNTFLNNDSVDHMQDFYVANTLSVSLLEGSTKWAFAGLTAYARFEFDRFSMPDTLSAGRSTEYLRRYNESNFIVGGRFEKAKGKNLTFNAGAETVILGNNLGDFTLDGQINLTYPIWDADLSIGAAASLSATTTPFFYEKFHSTFAWWDNKFGKQFNTHIGGYLEFEKTGTRLQIDVENINGYVYLKNDAGAYINADGVSQPSYAITAAQFDGAIQVVSATLQQNFKVGPLHWDNHITYQLSGYQTILPLPDLNLFSDLYFKFVYYKRLNLEIGANMLYFNRYDAPAYCPAVGMYHIQNANCIQKVGGYPLITGYVNCQLRGVRFYVLYYHANNNLLKNRDSFIVPGYPANPGMLKFGLSWTFYD